MFHGFPIKALLQSIFAPRLPAIVSAVGKVNVEVEVHDFHRGRIGAWVDRCWIN